MGELVATVAHRAVPGREQPVHRPLRRQIPALVEQRRPHLRGRAVDEPLESNSASTASRSASDSARAGVGCGLGGLGYGGRRRRKIEDGDANSARHDGRVPMIGVSSSTVSQINARCSTARPRYRASAPRALRRFLDLDHAASLRQLGPARSASLDSSAICASRRSAGLRRAAVSSYSAPSCAATASTSDATCTATRGATARRSKKAKSKTTTRIGSTASTQL